MIVERNWCQYSGEKDDEGCMIGTTFTSLRSLRKYLQVSTQCPSGALRSSP